MPRSMDQKEEETFRVCFRTDFSSMPSIQEPSNKRCHEVSISSWICGTLESLRGFHLLQEHEYKELN